MRPQKVSANQNTEERILSNALNHFCSFGYNGTSVREITASSEVTKPTLYYYFKNKQELFSKLAQTSFETVLKSVETALSENTGYKQSLLALFDSISHIFTVNPSALKFIHSIVVTPQRGTPEVGSQGYVEKLNSIVDQIISKGIAEGHVVLAKKESTKLIIIALLGHHTRKVLTGVDYKSEDRALMNLVLDSVIFCSSNAGCHS